MNSAFPRVHLAQLPTPIEPLSRLTKLLGGPTLFIKRDDQTGLAFGGNKTRKLEYLLADALSKNTRTLITGGADQSNHCRQTAAAAAKTGVDCILVLSGAPPEQPSGNLLIDKLLGAQVVWTDRENRENTMQAVYTQAVNEGKAPYLIPIGGSNQIGGLGYAYAMEELQAQESSFGPFDWIVFASSSGGTQAGMVAGSHVFQCSGKILGISIDEPAEVLQSHVAHIASQTTALLGKPHEFNPTDILVNTDYLGAGYGILGDPEREAVRMFAQTEGLLIDPVYTGRAAAGLIGLIRSGFFKADERVLFWHTGGTPALLAEKYQDII